MTQQTHNLKCWPEYFVNVALGLKPFELRYNDRNFQSGDYIRLQEFNPCRACNGNGRTYNAADISDCEDCKGTGGTYTGQSLMFTISVILSNVTGLSAGYVVMGLKLYEPEFKPLVKQPTEATRELIAAALMRMVEWIAKGGRLVQGQAKAGAPQPNLIRIQMDMTIERPDNMEGPSRIIVDA